VVGVEMRDHHDVHAVAIDSGGPQVGMILTSQALAALEVRLGQLVVGFGLRQ
jgi:hypothetical protein